MDLALLYCHNLASGEGRRGAINRNSSGEMEGVGLHCERIEDWRVCVCVCCSFLWVGWGRKIFAVRHSRVTSNVISKSVTHGS